jgi:hypothetical protein
MKMIKLFKTLLLVLVIIILIIVLIFLRILYISETAKANDTYKLNEIWKIIDNLKTEEIYDFEDVKAYNEIYWETIDLNNECTYLKGINWNGYIISLKLKYEGYINVYWKYYFYYSWKDQSFLDNQKLEIIKNLENKCNN